MSSYQLRCTDELSSYYQYELLLSICTDELSSYHDFLPTLPSGNKNSELELNSLP